MMKRIATLLALLAVCAAPAFAVSQIRVSQVYGGGGGSSTLYNFDYIELYNSGNTPVNIGGWYVEYGSAAGNWGNGASNQVQLPANLTLPPCSYYLIQAGTAGTAGGPLPVTPDLVVAGPNMAQGSGKVAIFNALNSNLACGSELAGTLVDKVAYGTANCAEGGVAAGLLTNTQADVRNNGGNTDTDNNGADFTVTSNPVPRNSQSPKNPSCQLTPTKSSTWGNVKQIYR
jgi:hypothetical protein